MYGLLMMKLYADEIVSGRTDRDARLYPTEKRGTIAIVDSSSFRIYATAELTEVVEIPYEEFVRWHQIGPFSETPIAPYSEGRACYAYILKNVRKLPVPRKLPRDPDARMWIDIPDDVSRNLFSQSTLI